MSDNKGNTVTIYIPSTRRNPEMKELSKEIMPDEESDSMGVRFYSSEFPSGFIETRITVIRYREHGFVFLEGYIRGVETRYYFTGEYSYKLQGEGRFRVKSDIRDRSQFKIVKYLPE